MDRFNFITLAVAECISSKCLANMPTDFLVGTEDLKCVNKEQRVLKVTARLVCFTSGIAKTVDGF